MQSWFCSKYILKTFSVRHITDSGLVIEDYPFASQEFVYQTLTAL